jgi:hypothetical protein
MNKYNPDIVETLRETRSMPDAVKYLEHQGVNVHDTVRALFGIGTPPRHFNCRSHIIKRPKP